MRFFYFALASIILSFSISFHTAEAAKKNSKKAAKKSVAKKKSEPALSGPELIFDKEKPLTLMTVDFRPHLNDWIRASGTTKFDKVAQRAQKYILKYGMIYFSNIKDILKENDGRRFIVVDNQEIDLGTIEVSDGPCEQKFIRVSVMGFDDGHPVVLTNHGEKVIKGLPLEHVRIRKNESDDNFSKIFVPASQFPWGVSADGKYVVWQLDLETSIMDPWWLKLTRRSTDLREERPFVTVRVGEAKFVVETNSKALQPHAYEQINAQVDKPTNLIRRRYKNKGWIVDSELPCN